jgi:RNA polymerase sigma-70 factor (ECF subfamily)
MSAPDPTFADFMRRIRAGDEAAAAELVRRYELHIRRIVRLHLEDQRLARLFDSMDVCQEVLLSIFVRAAAGQYDLDEPDQLLKLLVTMAGSAHSRRQSGNV